MALREPDEPRQIGEIGDRALRIGRRAEVECDGAGEQPLVERIEIGEKAGLFGRRQVDRFAQRGFRAGRVGGVERVRHQDRRRTGARPDVAFCGQCGKEQPLAGPVENQHLARRIGHARQAISLREPGRRRRAEAVGSLAERVTAKRSDIGRENGADETGHRVLRFADRKVDGRPARRDAGQELGRAHEGRARVGRTGRE